MSDYTMFECQIGTTDPSCPLAITVLLDGETIYANDSITETITVKKSIADNDQEHTVEFVMSGKLPSYTKIDEQGNIIKDALLTVDNVKLDEIEIKQILSEKAVYTHDFNGTGTTTSENFFGQIGCNGTVSFKFTTPVYLWLLENM